MLCEASLAAVRQARRALYLLSLLATRDNAAQKKISTEYFPKKLLLSMQTLPELSHVCLLATLCKVTRMFNTAMKYLSARWVPLATRKAAHEEIL